MDRPTTWALLLAIVVWTTALAGVMKRWRDAREQTPAWGATRSFEGAVEVRGTVEHPGVRMGLAGRTAREAIRGAGERVAPRGRGVNEVLSEGSLVEIGPDGITRVGWMPGERLLTLGLPMDFAVADAEALEALPGVGPATAARMLAWRDARGGIRSLDELRGIPGVGPKTVARIRPFLSVTHR
ncbi:MAG: hypothetical protein A2Y95_02255 [Deltaproteobacteria bacterium RBG_13_65_10]|nr:MAG: hypothetical protein A2Y95_02255 [Deltaproteobacteria bacterium RBG_13_65_10]